MLYRAVLLDYFNTLTTAVRRGPRHANIARLLGCEPARWVAALDRTFAIRARGGYGHPVDGLRRVADEAGGRPSTAQLLAAIKARVNVVCDDGPLRTDAAPALRALRLMGLRTAVVSDCWFELPMFLPRLAIAPLLDAHAFSVDVGVTKPHPAMYLAACDALGVEPRECVYVGDGGSLELTGAQLLGMTAVRIVAPDLGEHLTFNAEPGWSGPVIEALSELPSLVGQVSMLTGA